MEQGSVVGFFMGRSTIRSVFLAFAGNTDNQE